MGLIIQKMFSNNQYENIVCRECVDLEKGIESSASFEFSSSDDHHISIDVIGPRDVVWQYRNGLKWISLDKDTSARLEKARAQPLLRGDLVFKCFGEHSARVQFDTMEAHCADISCYADCGIPLHMPVKLRRIINNPI